MDNTLQVLDIQVLFPTTNRNAGAGIVQILPVLRLYLEDGSDFTMGSIPTDSAIAILQKIQNKANLDSRFTTHDVLNEICQIESVTIDCLVPKSSAFAATLKLTLEGFSNELQFQMIV